MSVFALLFVVVNLFALLILRREWAPIPLLIGSCYMTLGQAIELGPLTFYTIRLLIAVGFIRIFLKGERLAKGFNNYDWLVLVWGGWTISSSLFHENPFALVIHRLGLVYNNIGLYFLLRIFCPKIDDVVRMYRNVAIILVPLAIEMLLEKVYGRNFFSFLGGVPDFSVVRSGKIRAQGPFLHPILAGTVGAVNLPFMINLWHRYRKVAIMGIMACVTIIYASTSSGPVLTALIGICGMSMWRYRSRLRFGYCLGGILLGYLFLDSIMNAPAYYLLAHIDVTGGSTGWHRAKLIQSSLEHLSEWWLYGTDYTRHWMPYGVMWSENQIDITNQYISEGVSGGLPLLFLFIMLLLDGFFVLKKRFWKGVFSSIGHSFTLWTIGATLLAHTITLFSITYFDQSSIFFYTILAAIGSINSENGLK